MRSGRRARARPASAPHGRSSRLDDAAPTVLRSTGAMTLNRSLIAAACAVALVAGTAGCGSGDDSATSTASASEAWADNVCGALDTWQTELKSTAKDLKSGGVSKDALRGAADDAQSATKTLTDDLQSAGKPDTAA